MSHPHSWIKPLARAGYTSRGIVYLIIGFFAVLAAFGSFSNKGSKDALQEVLQQPFGTVLILILIVGLVGYVVWRLVQSLLDTDDHGWTPKGLVVRMGLLASAFTYASLALFALSRIGYLPFDTGGQGGEESGGFADKLASFVGSSYVPLILALIFLGVAGAHFYKAATSGYEEHFDASDKVMRFVHPISMIGLAARGITFAVISLLLYYRYQAGGQEDQSPPGIQKALEFVGDLPFGAFLLAVLGVGIMLFALYSLCEARWRKINVEDAT